MNKPVLKDNFGTGVVAGIVFIGSLYFILSGIDAIFLSRYNRLFFIKADTKQLLILATSVILFRHQIKSDRMAFGKGFFLSVFFISMAYILQKKVNFTTW